ncbi:MAG: hypothetical protein PF501_18575 [Salinisphaera sp.]|nr:hypothetical protein [Salinisphaera sp.]
MTRPGVVVALPGEARPLARLRSLGEAELPTGGRLILAGLGAMRARRAAEKLVAARVDGLISWGTAAALSDSLSSGDLILPRDVLGAEGHFYHSNDRWRSQLLAALAGRVPIRECRLAESRGLVATVGDKQRLWAATHADACDMESAAIAAVAAEHGLPFLAVRAIVDDSTMTLPPAARAAVSETGSLRPLALARSLAGRPASMHAQLRSLKHLAVAFRAARETLSEAAKALRSLSAA